MAKKKKKGVKFPWFGILALWVAYSTFDVHPILGIVTVVTLGLISPVAETIIYPFQKISEFGDKKGNEKKKQTYISHH